MKKLLKITLTLLSILLIVLLSTPYGLYYYGLSKVKIDRETIAVPQLNYKDDIYITYWITESNTNDMKMTPYSPYNPILECFDKEIPESFSIASIVARILVDPREIKFEKKLYRRIALNSMTIWVSQNLTIKQAMDSIFNKAYYGKGYNSLNKASLGYFNKKVNDLNIYEILTLHIIPFAPSYYSKNKKAHLERLNHYIDKLKRLYPQKYHYLEEKMELEF